MTSTTSAQRLTRNTMRLLGSKNQELPEEDNNMTTTNTAQKVTDSKQNNKQKRLRGEDVGLPVRRMNLSYDDNMPAAWFNDNDIASMFLTAFSASLPEGESHFIHSVRMFQDKITEPVLRAQIRAFIGQEGHHSKEHDTFNDSLRRKGVAIDIVENRMAKSVLRWKKRSPKYQLAHTVCAEHFTALLADFILTKHPEILKKMAPQARTIWAWHAIEEAEHKAVAFDVYDQVIGDRRYLRRTMVLVTAEFMIKNLRSTMTLLRGSRHLRHREKWKEFFSLLGLMGRSTWKDYKDFYKLDFHPWHHDNRKSLDKAKEMYIAG